MQVPVENRGGRGTADAHWRDAVFGTELMTGFVGRTGNPLSLMTIASLADLGYQVDRNAAEPYSLPERARPRGGGDHGGRRRRGGGRRRAADPDAAAGGQRELAGGDAWRRGGSHERRVHPAPGGGVGRPLPGPARQPDRAAAEPLHARGERVRSLITTAPTRRAPDGAFGPGAKLLLLARLDDACWVADARGVYARVACGGLEEL